MKTWWLVAAAVVLAASVGGYFGIDARAGAAQDCEDWVNDTNDRVNEARTYLYPADRPEAFEGSFDEAAENLYVLFEEQNNTDVPDNAFQLHYDLIEAFSEGAAGLASGGPEATIQVNFAKSIVYNADARLVSFVETC